MTWFFKATVFGVVVVVDVICVFVVVIVGPRNMNLKFGQNRVSNG